MKVTNTVHYTHKIKPNKKELPPFDRVQYCKPERPSIYCEKSSPFWKDVDCPMCKRAHKEIIKEKNRNAQKAFQKRNRNKS